MPNLEKTNMSNEQAKKTTARVTLSLPPELIFAAEALAAREYSTVSTICRRALADELISRGYLADGAA
jgi:hypothetical protein